jgi:hypothetical protein
MTQYMLAVHNDPDVQVYATPELMQQAFEQTDALNKELQEAGTWVFGGGLHEPSTATVVRNENGNVVVTDGPYTETKEQLAGYWIIDEPDLDAALANAAKASLACNNPLEVRPFQDEA